MQMKLSTPSEAEMFLQLRSVLSDKNTHVRDVNGFRKLLLALTSTGVSTCVHSHLSVTDVLASPFCTICIFDDVGRVGTG